MLIEKLSSKPQASKPNIINKSTKPAPKPVASGSTNSIGVKMFSLNGWAILGHIHANAVKMFCGDSGKKLL